MPATESSAPSNYRALPFRRAPGNRCPLFAVFFPYVRGSGLPLCLFSKITLPSGCAESTRRANSGNGRDAHRLTVIFPFRQTDAENPPRHFFAEKAARNEFFYYLSMFLLCQAISLSLCRPLLHAAPTGPCRLLNSPQQAGSGAGNLLPSFCCKRHSFFWHLPSLTFPSGKPILTLETFDTFLSKPFLFYIFRRAARAFHTERSERRHNDAPKVRRLFQWPDLLSPGICTTARAPLRP